jgi:CheY-like chemotaxis protein
MKGRVLLVEDEILVALMVKKKIEAAGYEVVGPAVTASEAITLAASARPDLLFMDVSLPGAMDGVEAATVICQEKRVPVLFFTGTPHDEQLRIRLAPIPGARVFDKLGDFTEVLKTVDQVLMGKDL